MRLLVMLLLFYTTFLSIPASGIIFYVSLVRRMRREQIPQSPAISLFFLFGCYGLLICSLLAIFLIGPWFTGAGYLTSFFISPVIMIVIAATNYPKRKISPYHRKIVIAAAAYTLVIVLILLSIAILPFICQPWINPK